MRVLFAEAIAGGDTLAPAPDGPDDAFDGYWQPPGSDVFVACRAGDVCGSYMLRPNAPGLGSHVANAGYIVAASMRGRGIASAMCAHSLETARRAGYRAMQFNFVVATNETAVRLWQRFGFAVVGRVPGAFRHTALGFVDVLIMHRTL